MREESEGIIISELIEDIVSDATAEQQSQAASPGKMKDGPGRQEEPAGRQEESLVEMEKTGSPDHATDKSDPCEMSALN